MHKSMTQKIWLWVAVAGIVFLPAAQAHAKIGIGTQFTDAVMENLEIGQSYNLRELRGVPYSVKNVGDAGVDIVVEVMIPVPKEMKENYEPIPDPNWIQLVPSQYFVPPGGTAFSDIIISIPNDPQLVGRHYQAFLWAHTKGTGMLGTGVKSRVRFSVGPGPDTLAEEKRKKAMVSLNYDIWPSAMYVNKAEPGKKYNVKKKENQSFRVTNRSEKPVELVLKAVPWDKRTPAPHGYEPLDNTDWIQLKPSRLKIKPFRVQEVKLLMNVPKKFKGQKKAFIIQATLPIGTIVSSSHRVLVTILEP